MIKFFPETHTYVNVNTGEKYTSVTTFLNHYKTEFDKQGISAGVARQRGISQQQVLAEWEAIAKTATDYGTAMHAAVERYIKTGTFEPDHEKLITEFSKLGNFKQSDGCLTEQMVHNHEYKIAGTSDIIQPVGKYFDVFDIKTNKAIHFSSKYDQYLNPPVAHLTHCEYNTYSLQLSLYAFLHSLLTGRTPRQLAIFHWDKKAETFTRYPVPYLLSDVKALLCHWKTVF